VFSDLRRYPKLVGGIDPISEKRGVAFYTEVLDFDERLDLPRPNGVWQMGSSEAAELAKLAETTYRDVNIALANQFALYSEGVGIDVYQVIEACNSQNFSHIHQPGIAVGGHCIPIYPHLYLHGDPDATVVSAARVANKGMPVHVVEKVRKELGTIEGMRIAILGLAYRGGVKEHAFSGTWDLVNEILGLGGVPVVHDPMYSSVELVELGLKVFELGEDCDAAIIQADHKEYLALSKNDIPTAKYLVDGRNISSTTLRNEVETYVIGQSM
jgi:nucleotide sugar dehydrogenase